MKAMLGLLAAVALAAPARAAVHSVPAQPEVSLAVPVAEGCGPGRFRDGYGYCRWMARRWGPPAFVARACPPGYHLGPYRGRCWPNY